MSATMVGRRGKILKLQLSLKRPKTAPPLSSKKKFWTRKQMILGVYLVISDHKNAKKIPHFTIQSRSKNLNLFNILAAAHCTAPFPDAFWKYLETKCLYIPVNLRKMIFVTETQEALIWLNNSLKAARCLDLVKCFKIFHFD